MPKNNYPREFLKLRDRIIEHIAIEEIVANMHSTGDFPIPRDWMEGAMSMKRWLLGLVEEEVKEERSEQSSTKAKKAVKTSLFKASNLPAWHCNECACDVYDDDYTHSTYSSSTCPHCGAPRPT